MVAAIVGFTTLIVGVYRLGRYAESTEATRRDFIEAQKPINEKLDRLMRYVDEQHQRDLDLAGWRNLTDARLEQNERDHERYETRIRTLESFPRVERSA